MNGRYALPKILRSNLFIKSPLFLEQRIYLPLGTELKNKVKVVIVFIMIIKLKNMIMVQLVHDFYFKFDLFNEVMLQYLLLVDDLDGKHVLGYLMSHFVNFSKTTNSNISIGK